jgi:hypothetical protein
MRKSLATKPPLGRLSAALAVLVALCGAAWANPSAAAGIAQIEPEVRSAPGAMPPPSAIAVEPKVRQQQAALPPGPNAAAPPPGLDVVRWGLGGSLSQAAAATAPAAVPPGGPLYLWMTLAGGPAALDRLRTEGRLAIEAHWTRDGGGPGAPDLVTRLSVADPGLAPTLAAEVRRRGYFQWHSWARKDTLSPGRWTVSLTYPDGRPLVCGRGAAAQPCRVSLDVG